MYAAAFLLISLLSAVAGEEHVVTLTDADFDSYLAETSADLVLVEFYAPWCGHCKRLGPELEIAAKRIKDDGKNIVIAKVNAEDEKKVAGRFEVRGYPTLFTFTGGADTKESYEGPREADGIINYLYKQVGPAVSELADAAAVENFLATVGKDTAILCYSTNADDVATFNGFAKANRNKFSFASVGSHSGPSKIVLHAAGGAGTFTFEDTFSIAKISAFVDANRFPLVGEISQDNYRDYLDRGLPLAWCFLDTDNAATLEENLASLHTAGADAAGKLSIVYLSGKTYSGMASRLGLDVAALPAVAIEEMESKKKFILKDAFSTESTTKFFADYLSGAITPHLKSEEEPSPNPGEDGVFVLTGKNFESAALGGDDVLIEFYAPWCGHCKDLAPKYSALAKKLASSPKLKIAKFDGTANDVPVDGFSFTGFPTIYFQQGFAAGESRPAPLEYKGARTTEELLDFVKTNAIHDI